ncbi:MAG: response regulator transcription factor [Actinomycetota bacterium]
MTGPGDVITILLIGHHDVTRLVRVLEREPDLRVIDWTSASEALGKLEVIHPRVVVLDQALHNMSGVELCRQIAKRRPCSAVVMLSGFSDEITVFDAMSAGARGYVVKNVDADGLIPAIRAVARGEMWLDPKVVGRFASWVMSTKDFGRSQLPPAQLRVLQEVAAGGTTATIARALNLSEHTVKSYLSRIYRLLRVANRAEAVAVATRSGLLARTGRSERERNVTGARQA